jgi:hypothetical protein
MPALHGRNRSRGAPPVWAEWPHIDQVWAKVDEEMRELKQAVASGDKIHTARS